MKRKSALGAGVVVVAYLILTIIATYPLIMHVRSYLPGDLGDPLLNTWILGWETKALMHHPLDIYNAPIFYPHPYALTYSENLFGFLALVSPVVSATGNLILGYNLSFLFTFWASFMGMYLLSLFLSKDRLLAFVIGAMFGLAPYHWAQIAHLHIIFYGGISFVLLAFALYIRKNSYGGLFLFGILYIFGILASLHVAVFSTIILLLFEIVLWRTGGLGRKPLVRLLLVEAIVLLISSAILFPYFFASRSIASDRLPQLATGGLVWATDFLSTSPLVRSLGTLTRRFREIHHYNSEMQLYPGAMLMLLSVIGIFSAVRQRRSLEEKIRIGGIIVLIIGFGITVGIGIYVDAIRMLGVHRWMLLPLYLVSPIRVAARWIAVAWIGVGVLAVFGLMRLRAFLQSRSVFHWYLGAIVVLFLGLTESWASPIPVVRVAPLRELPMVYRWMAKQPGDFAILELPTHYPNLSEETYRMYAQLLHGKKLILGYSGVMPKDVKQLYVLFWKFPIPDAIEKISALGRSANLKYTVIETGFDAPQFLSTFKSNLCWLREDGRLRFVKRFGDDYVFEVASSPGVRKFYVNSEGKIDADFPGFATLESYEEGTTSDGKLFVRLHWVVRGKWDYRKSVTVQVFDSNGKLLAQSDGPPVKEEFLSCWVDGARISDLRILNIKHGEEGKIARIGVSAYFWKTLKRVPAESKGHRLSGDMVDLPVLWKH